MKSTFIPILILFSSSLLTAQMRVKQEPFIIRGQLTDCPEKSLQIFFENKNGEQFFDTIHLDSNGFFNFKTYNVTHPQRTRIQQNNVQINDFFIAPGYNLTFTGNARDFSTLMKSKKISGNGAQSNRYRFLLDSILFARNDTTKWYLLHESEVLHYIEKEKQLKDSVANLIFKKNVIGDKYHAFFGKMVKYDNLFIKLYRLLKYVNSNRYTYEKSISFIKNNFDTTILNNLYSEDFLISEDYKKLVIATEYLNYLVNLDYLKDSTLRNIKGYKLEKVNKVYYGKTREFVLQKLMTYSIDYSKTIDQLNEYKLQFEPYITSLKNIFFKKSVETKFFAKEAELFRTQIGQPAPEFTLENNFGSRHSLSDFRGKLVYLDLWASWCVPCREEIPSMKKLYEKYKNDNRISIISIAVYDGINEWKKALVEDKPEWIQLLDKDGSVRKSYIVYTIPRFILIDKQGKIAHFDAPRPGNIEELEKFINREIIK